MKTGLTHPAFASRFIVTRSVDVFIVGSENETHFLHGTVARHVVPLLSGRLTVTEIIEHIADVPADEVVQFLAQLEQLHLLVESSGAPQNEAAFWEFAGADSKDVSLRRTDAAVELRAVQNAPLAGMAEALVSLGLAVRPGAGFRLVAATDYCDPALEKFHLESLARGLPWMLVRPSGREQWLGPIFIPGRTACWRCLTHALLVNGWRAETAVATLPVFAAVTRTLAAAEAAKWLLAGTPLLAGRFQAFDTLTLAMNIHRVIRRPQCPDCGGPSAVPLAPDALVSRFTGLVESVQDLRMETGLCLAEARASRVLWPAPTGGLFYSRKDLFLGKGASILDSRGGCLGEAVERYSCRYHGDEPLMEATFEELAGAALDPRGLLLYSEAQYADAGEWNLRQPDFHRVGAPFDPLARIAWTPVQAWTSGEIKYVPAGYCYMGFENQYCGSDTNGCASAPEFGEAVLRGLCELIERDAVALWWYNRARRPRVAPEITASARILLLTQALCERGRTVEILDLTTGFGIPVCVAASVQAGGSRIVIGAGAALDMEAAAWRALAEAGAQILAQAAPEGSVLTREEQAVADWLNGATLENQSWICGLPPQNHVQEGAADLGEAVRRVEGAGCCVYVRDLTRRELNIPAVRVIVPGLRPWWARFAPGRLYDAPVELGWQHRCLNEAELNPTPFFL